MLSIFFTLIYVSLAFVTLQHTTQCAYLLHYSICGHLSPSLPSLKPGPQPSPAWGFHKGGNFPLFCSLIHPKRLQPVPGIWRELAKHLLNEELKSNSY